MPATDRVAVLGGTFTPLHDGHMALLHSAFQTASHDGDGEGHVVVGLTSTDLAGETRSDPEHARLLGPYEERRAALEDALATVGRAYTASHEIVELADTHGPAVTREGADVLVVAPEGKAHRRAHDINDERLDRGHPPLEIYTSPFVVAEDGHRISSTRIRNGEIDRHGRLLDD
ncbi:phosphopantetheine adenylyltransferase [Haloarcula litorea]|uniref:phosphopantetheine adenylyltransferase n=1 Tax=Haloarcula litorea TaxID=3032579 RepID=UPI0023E7C092|nr:pantetheine-phosphate adenylyltransferase [Halomicroarcula sp. GDY20]